MPHGCAAGKPRATTVYRGSYTHAINGGRTYTPHAVHDSEIAYLHEVGRVVPQLFAPPIG